MPACTLLSVFSGNPSSSTLSPYIMPTPRIHAHFITNCATLYPSTRESSRFPVQARGKGWQRSPARSSGTSEASGLARSLTQTSTLIDFGSRSRVSGGNRPLPQPQRREGGGFGSGRTPAPSRRRVARAVRAQDRNKISFYEGVQYVPVRT